jgi:hypothetical protein
MKRWFALMQKRRAGERGVALIMVIILLVLMVILIPSALMFTATGRKVTQVYEKNTKAYYAAEAGIEDGKWQIKYDQIATALSSYSPYDYSSVFGPYSLADNAGTRLINSFNVQVYIQNIWAPYGLTAPDAVNGKRIIEGTVTSLPKVIITSNVYQAYNVDPDTHIAIPGIMEITIQYYPDVDDNLLIKTLGIWLPQGFTYHPGFTNNMDNSVYYTDSTHLPVITDHLKGKAIVWNFNQIVGTNSENGYPFVGFDTSHPAFPSNVAGTPLNSSAQAPLVSKIYFSFDAAEAGDNPQAVTWVNTNTGAQFNITIPGTAISNSIILFLKRSFPVVRLLKSPLK